MSVNADMEEQGQKSTRDLKVREEAFLRDLMGAGTNGTDCNVNRD